MTKTAISILVLGLSALYAITPLLLHHEFVFGGDVGYHINWAYQVSLGIREGIFYPRWLSLSNGGYGSPTMIFYSPLFYLLTGAVNTFVPSLIVSLKIITFLGFFISGISMYVFMRNFCTHAGSVAGGIAYQLMPYHIFDLYWRGTFAETFVFAWLPLILHFIYRGDTRDTIFDWLGMAFSYAGLVLTHIATAYIFTFVMAAFVLFLSFSQRNFGLLPKSMLAAFFGLSLSAIYFIPMFFERGFVHIGWITEVPWGDYTRNFLFMNENSDNPLHINLEHIFLLKAFLVVISLTLVYYRSRQYGKLSNAGQVVFFSWLFVFSLFISISLSMPIWRLIPGLSTIQFPWRWVLVSTLSSSILIGMTVDLFSFEDIKNDRFIRVCTAVFHALLVANIYIASFYMITAGPIPEKDMEWILRDGGDVIEYRPVWLTDKKKGFSKEKRTYVIFEKGKGKIDIVNWKSHFRLFKMSASIPATLRISTFYYPGWTALVNGREIPIEIEKDSGVMLLNIPPGENEVLLEFRDTPLRRGAKWISVVSLLAAFIGLIAAKRNRMALF